MSLKSKIKGVAEHDFKYKRYGNSICKNDWRKQNEFGYIPNYDELIAEAPNAEMVAKWEQCRELHKKIGKRRP